MYFLILLLTTNIVEAKKTILLNIVGFKFDSYYVKVTSYIILVADKAHSC